MRGVVPVERTLDGGPEQQLPAVGFPERRREHGAHRAGTVEDATSMIGQDFGEQGPQQTLRYSLRRRHGTSSAGCP